MRVSVIEELERFMQPQSWDEKKVTYMKKLLPKMKFWPMKFHGEIVSNYRKELFAYPTTKAVVRATLLLVIINFRFI